MLIQCRFNVGPPSLMLLKHQNNINSVFLAYWDYVHQVFHLSKLKSSLIFVKLFVLSWLSKVRTCLVTVTFVINISPAKILLKITYNRENTKRLKLVSMKKTSENLKQRYV